MPTLQKVWELMSKRSFNSGEPIAFFITWTTYGTWLPGDERGWRQKGAPGLRPANPLFEEMAATTMKETALALSRADRELVKVIVARHCEIRKWVLHAISARTNHVHVILTASGRRPETVRDQLKSWCTRGLKALHPERTRFWTEGASCRWINDEDDLEVAFQYVADAQDRKGRE